MKNKIIPYNQVEQRMMKRPHVVLLGAGASRAACPNGDKNGLTLPLINDFIDILEINNLKTIGLNFNLNNFEDLYSHICQEEKYQELKKNIEEKIYSYFKKIEIPNNPTIYDHLILSLRKKDVIATFNWDPLLVQAYLRNRHLNGLPNLIFLHGNVMVGYCEKENKTGLKNTLSNCSNRFKPTALLYPITQKKYDKNGFLTSQWKTLQSYIRSAFMISFFGYSAPKSDTRAIDLMKYAWGELEKRNMEQIEIIDIKPDDALHETWAPFIYSHHYEIHNNFYESWIAKHPCRTVEAYFDQYWNAKFIDDNPIPKDFSFQELWLWIKPLR